MFEAHAFCRSQKPQDFHTLFLMITHFSQRLFIRKHTANLITLIFEDENFSESRATVKATKITSLEDLYVYSVHLVGIEVV